METSKQETLSQVLSFRSFIFAIILAIFVYLLIMIFGDWEDLIKQIFNVDPLVVMLAVFLSLGNYFCRFFKWLLFTRSLELNIPFKDNFLIFFAGLSLSITPAKVGEAIRAFFLQKTSSVELSKGLASTFSERLIDLLAVTILALLGVFVLEFRQSVDFLPILVIILLGILLGVLIFLFDPLYNIFSWIFHLKPWFGVGKKIDKFRSDVVVTFHYDVFLGALLLGIIGWTCEGIGFFLLAQSLGISITFETSIFIYATSSLLGAVSFLPGGLGVMEGSMELFLVNLLVISLSTAGALVILIRMTTLWFGVTLGLIFLLLITQRLGKNVSEQSKMKFNS
ncbi:MAG: flippase-like domain-containing protein [Candidatus Heimdallarchaeota archaeon]|nr:MAG: flippase-like domain-containing protein [Candidatus Heimdallarchaeota archaeon]